MAFASVSSSNFLTVSQRTLQCVPSAVTPESTSLVPMLLQAMSL